MLTISSQLQELMTNHIGAASPGYRGPTEHARLGLSSRSHRMDRGPTKSTSDSANYSANSNQCAAVASGSRLVLKPTEHIPSFWPSYRSMSEHSTQCTTPQGMDVHALPGMSHLLAEVSTTAQPPMMSTLTPPPHGGLGGVYTHHLDGVSHPQALTPNSYLPANLEEEPARTNNEHHVQAWLASQSLSTSLAQEAGPYRANHTTSNATYSSFTQGSAHGASTRKGPRLIGRGQGHAHSRSCPQEVEETMSLPCGPEGSILPDDFRPKTTSASLEFGPGTCLDFVSPKPHSPPTQAEVAQWFAAMVCYIWFKFPESSEGEGAPVSSIGERLRLDPSPSFVEFVRDTLNTTQLSNAVILLALLYIRRVRSQHSSVPAWEGAEYRLAISALMLANKMHEDSSYTSATWSEIVKIPVKELNQMEVELWLAVPSMWTSSDQYFDWVAEVTAMSQSREAEKQAIRNRRVFEEASAQYASAPRSGDATRRRSQLHAPSQGVMRHSLGNIFESVGLVPSDRSIDSQHDSMGNAAASPTTLTGVRQQSPLQSFDFTFRSSSSAPLHQTGYGNSVWSHVNQSTADAAPAGFCNPWHALGRQASSNAQRPAEHLDQPSAAGSTDAKRSLDLVGVTSDQRPAQRRRQNPHSVQRLSAAPTELRTHLDHVDKIPCAASGVSGAAAGATQINAGLGDESVYSNVFCRQRSTFEDALTPDVLIAPFTGSSRAHLRHEEQSAHGRAHPAGSAPLHYWTLAAGHAYGRANQYMLPPIPGAHQFVPPASINPRRAEHTPSPLAARESFSESSYLKHVPAITSTPWPTPTKGVGRKSASRTGFVDQPILVSPSTSIRQPLRNARVHTPDQRDARASIDSAQTFAAPSAMAQQSPPRPAPFAHAYSEPQDAHTTWALTPHDSHHYRPFVANTHHWPISRPAFGSYSGSMNPYDHSSYQG